MHETETPEASTIPQLLARLPWFRDLSADHRRELVEQVQARMALETSRDHYAALLGRWSEVAHVDQKWARYKLLRESGLLSPR